MMDEVKKAEIRAILGMCKQLCPQVKSMEQMEAEAREHGLDLRSYAAGYGDGFKDCAASSFSAQSAHQEAPREPRDITNLWGLIP